MPGFNDDDIVRSHRWILMIQGFADKHLLYAKKIELPVFDGETGTWTEMLIQFYQSKSSLAYMVNNIDNLCHGEVEIKIILGPQSNDNDWEEAAWKITAMLREFIIEDLDYEQDNISTMEMRFKTRKVVLGKVGRATGAGGFVWNWDADWENP